VAIGDVDGNGLNDIYGLVHDDALTGNPDDFVFLNNGGLQFDRRTVPSATGDGNAVATLRRTPARNPEFIVLNGREQMDGPIQLIGLSGGAP
jgi:hypothetical protein